jgi:hypothetical protein
MAHIEFVLPDGNTLTMPQLQVLYDLTHDRQDRTHWHLNECKCCITIHAPEGSYVVNSDGVDTLYPDQHCGCGPEVHGQTT